MLSLSPHAKKLSLLVLVAAFAVAAHADILATASYTDTQVSPGVYDYSITLDNTGTTTIGTFWFSWIPGTGFLSAVPTDLTSPAGWTESLKPGTAGKVGIQWVTTTDLLNPGLSLTGFSFESTETPAQMLLNFAGTPGTGDPVTTSTVYAGAPQVGTADMFIAAPAPEPGSMLLTLTGLGLVALSLKSRLLRQN
jgi:hypothetical protein